MGAPRRLTGALLALAGGLLALVAVGILAPRATGVDGPPAVPARPTVQDGTAAARTMPPRTEAAAAAIATVPAGIPLRVSAPSIGLRHAVTPYTDDEVAAHGGAVEPPTLFTVSWWAGGGAPGTAATNTVYLFGHTWKEPAVFNRLKELRPGAAVEVSTAHGTLTYTVDGWFVVSKSAFDTDDRVRTAVPGRLLLVGCYRATGAESHTTANIVVTAQLSGSTATG